MLNIFRNHRILYLVTIATFGIAIGALWEVTEWSAGKIVSTQVIESLDDTIIDLVMDTMFYSIFYPFVKTCPLPPAFCLSPQELLTPSIATITKVLQSTTMLGVPTSSG